jgi:NADPH:quinone reductase-like Zn-dependent oxidoreductase
MRVVRLRAPGGPEQLAVEEAGRPRPGPGEALVRVQAAAITRDELQWPVDRLPAIPSYELAGVVEEAGPRRRRRRAGRRGLRAHPVRPGRRRGRLRDRAGRGAGGEAAVAQPRRERCCPPARADRLAGTVRPRPARGGRARADPRCGGRRRRARRPARSHARRVRGRERIGGGPGTGARARCTGGRRRGDELRGRGGARRPRFDTVGGERLRRSRAVLRPGGRLVSVAEEPPDGGEYFIVEVNHVQLAEIARLADAGELRPPAIEIFLLASAREAFARSLERGRRGKVVLAVR